jgi:DNA-binding CsgD family transcriptional regulator
MRRAHPLLNDGRWLRQQYLGQGRTTAEIAADLGVAGRTVRLALADHDIPIRRRGRPSVLDAAAEAEVVQRYGAGHSMRAVGLVLGLGEDMVRDTLLRRGEPIRGRGGRRPADSALPRQLHDTQWLSDRRLEGMSIRQIATLLGVSSHAVANALRRSG